MRQFEIRRTFVADLQRFRKTADWTQQHKLDLEHLFDLLIAGDPLPPEFSEHVLKDRYAGFTECHLDEDWLVIYKARPELVILHRTGTHAMLFPS